MVKQETPKAATGRQTRPLPSDTQAFALLRSSGALPIERGGGLAHAVRTIFAAHARAQGTTDGLASGSTVFERAAGLARRCLRDAQVFGAAQGEGDQQEPEQGRGGFR